MLVTNCQYTVYIFLGIFSRHHTIFSDFRPFVCLFHNSLSPETDPAEAHHVAVAGIAEVIKPDQVNFSPEKVQPFQADFGGYDNLLLIYFFHRHPIIHLPCAEYFFHKRIAGQNVPQLPAAVVKRKAVSL